MPTDKDLSAAIDSNKLDDVKRIIENEDGISYAHAYDYSSPLLQATELGSFEIVQYLLKRNYCFIDEGIEETCYSPLMAACKNGYVEIVKMLIQHGADVNRQLEEDDKQESALTLAIENCHANVVKILLSFGARTDQEKWSYSSGWNFRETPLLLAIQQNHIEIVEMLLKYNADVDGMCIINGETHTPLSYAVAKKNSEWIQFLLKHGSDSGKVIEDGFTVTKYAESLGRLELLSENNL